MPVLPGGARAARHANRAQYTAPREVDSLPPTYAIEVPHSSTLFLNDILTLRDSVAEIYDALDVAEQIRVLGARIEDGTDKLVTLGPKLRPAAIAGIEGKIAGLVAERDALIRRYLLPLEALDSLMNLLRYTTDLGLKDLGAYVRIHIPGIIDVSADLLFEEVPF